MREIKFRAWKNRECEIFKVEKIDFSNGIYYQRTCQCCGDDGYTGYEINEIKLMQYTGCIDLNGREIYEGDILMFSKKSRYEVKFGEFSNPEGVGHGWYVQNIKSNTFGGSLLPKNQFIVMGNIYKDKELLNERD